MKPITLAHNAVTCKMVDAPRETKLLVQQLLSYQVEGFERMCSISGSGWNGRSSFFEFGQSTFPAGFVLYVHSSLVKAGYKVHVVRRPLPVPLGPEHPVVDTFVADPRYDYQDQVVDKVVRHGQIIAQVATGGGKSRVAKLAHARIGRPTLFLTTRGILMHQMRSAFVKDMKIKVGMFGDDAWTKSERMNVGMVQTFAARLEDKTVRSELDALKQRRNRATAKEVDALQKSLQKAGMATGEVTRRVIDRLDVLQGAYPSEAQSLAELKAKVADHQTRRLATIELLQSFEFVILEEAHEASGNSYYDILRHCKNAHYRLALTATPFMKDSEEANMRLMGCSGPIAIKVSEKMLIDRGILAKPYFKYVQAPPSKGLYKTTPWPKAYEVGISKCPNRNAAIVREVVNAIAHGLTAMVLIHYTEHGKILAGMLTDAGVRCNFIQGENNQAERQAAISALKEGRIDALIGSTILDVGVDVPAIGMVVLGSAGKAEVALRQRVGRGLREKKDGGPNVAFIVDFTDTLNNHLRDHARSRRAIIEATPGFVEGILPPGSDFPYARLGFERKAA